MNNECHKGICVAPPTAVPSPAPCTPATIYFDFNESSLTVEATQILQEDFQCIRSVSKREIMLEGHCDPRGTDEYNMALADRRAQSVKRYLERLGIEGRRMIPVSKGKLEATGINEATWALDRKVNFIWQ